jgi:syntaxin 1A/syntaxin 1B/2/3
MNTFFEELANLKEKIVSIKGCIDEIRSIHDKTLNNVISEQQNAEISRELDAAMDRTNKQAAEVRTKLKEMDAVNKALQKKEPTGNDTTIRVAQVLGIHVAWGIDQKLLGSHGRVQKVARDIPDQI